MDGIPIKLMIQAIVESYRNKFHMPKDREVYVAEIGLVKLISLLLLVTVAFFLIYTLLG